MNWHRLDNTANIFPVISHKRFSSVYRISVRLKQDIIPDLLAQALNETLPLFPNFCVRLKKGIFWYYFENNNKQPLIEEEQFIPCGYIDPSLNNQFLFKVKYYKKRISLEVFHAITDGTGSIRFLKELTFRYLRLAHPQDQKLSLTDSCAIQNMSNIEDSYLINYEQRPRTKYNNQKSYAIKGDKLPLFAVGIIHGHIDIKNLLAICRKEEVSITQYFSAVLIWSIYNEYLNRKPNPLPIMLTIPVNLRPYFSSTTMMNFFTLVLVGLKIRKSSYTFKEILDIVSKQFKEKITKKTLSDRISYNVSAEKNIFIRFFPLFIKNIALKVTYMRSSRASTMSFTNVGKIEVPQEYIPYINTFEVLLSANNAEPIKCSLCSFNDKAVVSFMSRLKDTSIQRAFFRKLAADGLNVTLESNGAHYENL